jgi:hypothetical protein
VNGKATSVTHPVVMLKIENDDFLNHFHWFFKILTNLSNPTTHLATSLLKITKTILRIEKAGRKQPTGTNPHFHSQILVGLGRLWNFVSSDGGFGH